MRAKVIFDNGGILLLEENGEIVGSERRIRGAIRFNRRGRKVDAYFTREVTTRPESIPWRFEAGTQRTKLYDDDTFLEGSYVVVRDDSSVNQRTLF